MRGRALLLVIILATTLSGCLDGSGTDMDEKRWEPVVLPDTITGMDPVAVADDRATEGIWVEDGIAYLSGPEGLRILDVADPADPILLAEAVAETDSSRDVDLLHHPDGRLYAVVARGGAGITLVDVTDPATPETVTTVDLGSASAHNIAVVPGAPVVYNSRSISEHVPGPGTTGQVDVLDFTDPRSPAVSVFAFPAVAMTVGGVPRPVAATTCHDITFEAQLDRAYCAGVTDTQVWDISDPLLPEILQIIDWPGNNIHHGAWGTHNGTLLLIGDEFAGAVAGPVCSSVDEPYAALWFFDISDLSLPTPLGWYQVPYDSVMEQDAALCTTHFGTLVEDRDLFVLGWYTAGTVLVDFSDPADARTVDHFRPDGPVDTWESRYWNGHVFTGDTERGMDILRLV